MAFALSQSGHSLEPGFRQGREPEPRPVFSRHPISVAKDRSFDRTDLALIGLVAAISTLLLVNVALILL